MKVMTGAERPNPIKFQPIALIALLFGGCGLKGTAASTCSTSTTAAPTAQITVTDGTVSRDCGCAEGSSVFSAGATNFQCTVPINTRLYVEYNTTQSHRITFGTSPPQELDYTPGDPSPGAITFSSTSSGVGDGFADSQTAVTGYFIVTSD